MRGGFMVAINAIYDGNYFKPVDPVPVKGGYEVVITFVKPIEDDREAKCRRLLECCGTWDDEDVRLVEEMVAERGNFFKRRNREEV
jgi:predicted DNA-binding antitoxin AbrB/MazE fold protein